MATAAMGATCAVWFGEGIVAITEVAQQVKMYKELHPGSPDLSFQEFHEKVAEVRRTYPLHSASELVDIQISLKKEKGGFAASGLQK